MGWELGSVDGVAAASVVVFGCMFSFLSLGAARIFFFFFERESVMHEYSTPTSSMYPRRYDSPSSSLDFFFPNEPQKFFYTL
jgi:hypothetical protein